ncbi:MAG: right-handed parallel beta-helix repeat-containing protein, partial [Candidatus Woesearchaeota archaeon]
MKFLASERNAIIVMVIAGIGALFILLAGTGSIQLSGGITGLAAGELANEPTENLPPEYTQVILTTPYETQLTVDLSHYFNDPEGDELTFIVAEEDVVKVSVDGTIATFAPMPGFAGERTLTVIASDGTNVVRAPMKLVVGSATAPEEHAPEPAVNETALVPETNETIEPTINETLPTGITGGEVMDVVNSCEPGPVLVNSSVVLTQNLASSTTCLAINSSNVTIDCAGYNITYGSGGGNYAHAITASHRDNITITGCTLWDVNAGGTDGYGINFTNITNGFIINNTIITNGTSNNYGIYARNTAYNITIANNTILTRGTNTNNHGIYLVRANYTLVENNTIIANGTSTTNYGIYMLTSVHNSTIANNTILVGGTGTLNGIRIETVANNTIANNKITIAVAGTGLYDIVLSSASSNRILGNSMVAVGTGTIGGVAALTASENNTILENSITVFATSTTEYGISLSASSFNTIANNTINASGTGTIYGIQSTGTSGGNTIRNNTIRVNGTSTNIIGISLTSTTYTNTVSENAISVNSSSYNGAGIQLLTTVYDSNISNNAIVTTTSQYGVHGIWMTSGTYRNKVFNNTILVLGGASYGILFETAADNNTIEENILNITQKDGAGIYLNSVTGNNISNNTIFSVGEGLRINGTLIEHYSRHKIANNTVNGSNITYFGGAYGSPACPNNMILGAEQTAHMDFISCQNITLIGYQTFEAMSLVNTTNITLQGIKVLNGRMGITIINASNNIITGASITANTSMLTGACGISIVNDANNNLINDSNITANGASTDNIGILLNGIKNTTVSRVIVRATGNGNTYGIYLTPAYNITITNSDIRAYGTGTYNYGAYLLGTVDAAIANTTFAGNGSTNYNYGILIAATNNTVTVNSTIIGAGAAASTNVMGVYLSGGSLYNTIENGTIRTLGTTSTTSHYGLYALASSKTNITNNRFVLAEGSTFIFLDSASANSSITRNNMTSATGQYGIRISSAQSNNNTIAFNVINMSNPANDIIDIGTSVAYTTIENNTIDSYGGATYGMDIGGLGNASIANNIVILYGTARQGIRSLSDGNILNNNTIIMTASGTPNYGLVVADGADYNTVSNTNITLNGTSANIGLLVGASSAATRNNFTNTTIAIRGSSTSNNGLQIQASSHNNTFVNTIIITNASSSHGIYISGTSRDCNFNYTNITTYGANSYGIQLSSAYSHSFNHTTIKTYGTGSTGIYFSTSTDAMRFNNTFFNDTAGGWIWHLGGTHNFSNTTFAMTDGSINIPYNFTGFNVSKLRLNITYNKAFLNSTNLTYLNTTGIITLYGVIGDTIKPLVDYEDDGTYENCPASQCTELSYTEGVAYVFNTTHFTSYTSQPSFGSHINLTKTDYPDPVNISTNLTYQINVTSDGEGYAYNVTVNETYPEQVIYLSSQPDPQPGTNFSWFLGDMENDTSIVINITVLVKIINANGTVINNTANVTYQKATGEFVKTSVTENTTINIPLLPALTDCAEINYSMRLVNNVVSNSSCMVFNNDSIVLDCAGYNITYGVQGGNDTYGVNITSRKNIVLKNCGIRKGNNTHGERGYGILLINSSSATINNNTIITNGSSDNVGIYVSGGTASMRRTLVDNPSDINNPYCTNASETQYCKICYTTPGVDCAYAGQTACTDGIAWKEDTLLRFNANNVLGGEITIIGGESVYCVLNNEVIITIGYARNMCGYPKTETIPASAFVNGLNNLTCNVTGGGRETDNGFKLSKFYYITQDPAYVGISSMHTIENNTVITAGGNNSYGIYFSGNNSAVANNTITTLGDSSGHCVFVESGTTNTTFARNTLLTRAKGSSAIYLIEAANNFFSQNRIRNATLAATYLNRGLNNTFNESYLANATSSLFIDEANGTINYTTALNIFNTTLLSQVVGVGFNRHFVNSSHSLGQQLNKTAILRFLSIPYDAVNPVVDLEDNNYWIACTPPRCTNKTYNATTGIVQYNVSSFTTYSNSEASDCGNLDLAYGETSHVFTLLNNVTASGTCFNILDDNITLDCAGYTIKYGSSGSGYGIYSQDTAGIRIKNCKIEQSSSTGQDSHGIYLTNTSGVLLENNTISTYGLNSHSIYVNNSLNAKLDTNNLTAGGDALRIDGTLIQHWSTHEINDTNKAAGINVSYYGGKGTSPPCPNNQILTAPESHHITLVNCNNVVLAGINVSDTITLVNITNSIIKDSRLTNSSISARILFSENNSIHNSTISAYGSTIAYGLQVINSTRTNTTYNNISALAQTGSVYAIHVQESGTTLVENNNITLNRTGLTLYAIRIANSNNTVTTNNQIRTPIGTTIYPIYASNSARTNITNTTINANSTSIIQAITLESSSTSLLSGNNLTINSTGATLYAIHLTNSNSTLADNNRILIPRSTSFSAVYASNSAHTNITNTIIVANATSTAQAIFLENSGESTIIGNNITINNTGATTYAISLTDSNDSTTSNNTITLFGTTNSKTYGTNTVNCLSNNIINNKITIQSTGTSITGIHSTSSNYSHLAHNTISLYNSINNTGIFINTSNLSNISNNNITINGLTYNSTGITLNNIIRNDISQNNILIITNGTNTGILIIIAETNYIIGNNINITGNISDTGYNPNRGIELYLSNYTSIASNIISATTPSFSGIAVEWDSLEGNITNNIIRVQCRGMSGIYCGRGLDRCNIKNNRIYGNTTKGCYAIAAFENITVVNNTINCTEDLVSWYGHYAIDVGDYSIIENNTLLLVGEENYPIIAGYSVNITNNLINITASISDNYPIIAGSNISIRNNIIDLNTSGGDNYIIIVDYDSVIENNYIVATGMTDSNYGIMTRANSVINNNTLILPATG